MKHHVDQEMFFVVVIRNLLQDASDAMVMKLIIISTIINWMLELLKA